MERRQLFRLCHSCGHLNESEEEILRCTKCNKGFLPINYFDKIRNRIQQMSDQQKAAAPDLPNIVMTPINGLIVFW